MAMILIHACPKRMWYVEQYLVPSLKEQGIKDIKVYNDVNQEGLLTAFTRSAEFIDYQDAWHLQDDVIISDGFKVMTDCYPDGIVCGFANGYSDGKQPGIANLYNMWYSMPCIRIPGKILFEFVNWLHSPSTCKKYMAYLKENKNDDLLFINFLQETYPKMKVWNVAPNLVNHIDHLLGGSIVNKQRSQGLDYIMSRYWDEPMLLEDIERRLSC